MQISGDFWTNGPHLLVTKDIKLPLFLQNITKILLAPAALTQIIH